MRRGVEVIVLSGQVEPRLLDELQACRGQHAKDFQHAAAHVLEVNGFTVKREYVVPNRGDGYRGRLDLMAWRDDLTLAVELDNCSMRSKSLLKLASVKADAHVVMLRDGTTVEAEYARVRWDRLLEERAKRYGQTCRPSTTGGTPRYGGDPASAGDGKSHGAHGVGVTLCSDHRDPSSPSPASGEPHSRTPVGT
jgi:hypothetical protein